MERIYSALVNYHLKNYSQMIFLGGPRQVGKTTIAKDVLHTMKGIYLTWDMPQHRDIILNHLVQTIADITEPILNPSQGVLILDEIHKYQNWKNELKGIYDTQKDRIKIIVTGSARLDLYKKGGDSLMGRYFPYTVHPLSVREIVNPSVHAEAPSLLSDPQRIPDDLYEALWTFGGFPEPFIHNNKRFHTLWKSNRFQQLFQQDIRDMESIQNIAQLELLAIVLNQQIGQLLNYTSLSTHIRVSDQTIRRWLDVLENVYYCFRLSPWSKNLSRSLLKDPKIYLWDWSSIQDPGARFENFIASHLRKAVSFWNETGLGNFNLHFCRTKDQKEVDFLVTRGDTPWMLIEAKHGNTNRISPTLTSFQKELGAPYALQVVQEMAYVDRSCFDSPSPIIVPAHTFLSQLV